MKCGMIITINHEHTTVRFRYIITIDESETPAYVSKELQPGIITIMITARRSRKHPKGKYGDRAKQPQIKSKKQTHFKIAPAFYYDLKLESFVINPRRSIGRQEQN